MYKQRRKLPLIIIGAAVLLTVGAYIIVSTQKPSADHTPAANPSSNAPQSHHTYGINIIGNTTYGAAQLGKLTFDIRNESNTVLKNFDTVNQQRLQAVVVRKDRTNPQLLTPEYDTSTGLFTIPNMTFPANGDYRLFAVFIASDAQKDDMGMKTVSVLYKDLKVGSETSTLSPAEDEKLTSTISGFETTLSMLEGDSPGIPTAYAGLPLPLAVSISKDKKPYVDLQSSDGLLGHMVIISPSLQLIPVVQQPDATSLQTGLLIFSASFPDAGLYKIYVQVKAQDQLQTFDYNFTVKPMPGNHSSNTTPEPKGN